MGEGGETGEEQKLTIYDTLEAEDYDSLPQDTVRDIFFFFFFFLFSTLTIFPLILLLRLFIITEFSYSASNLLSHMKLSLITLARDGGLLCLQRK